MKQFIALIAALLLYTGCSQVPKKETTTHAIKDGLYQAMRLGTDTSRFNALAPGEVAIVFDTLFNPDEYTRVVIDTLDYVPMELEKLPAIEKQTELKNLLSVTLTTDAAQKMRTFTANRVMKQVVVVLDGKAVTLHKIRAAITGNQMQITRCDDNACDYLYVKLKSNVK